MKGVAISFREIVKSFDKKLVLDRVSLEVSPGEVLVLLGRSGCGKTTLLRLVNRLVSADSGEVYVGGREVTDWDPVALRRGIGYAIQEVGLLPHLSVSDNVSLVPRLLGWNPERRRERAAEMLRLVGLDPREHGVAVRISSRADSASASASPARWPRIRARSSWTSPSARWIRSADEVSRRSSGPFPANSGRPFSSLPTT